LQMMGKADEAGVMAQLPLFVASRLSRIPQLKPEDLEVCLIAKKLECNTKKLASLQELVEKHIVGAATQPSAMCSSGADLTDGKQTYQHERDVVPGDKAATPVCPTSSKESYANYVKRPARPTVLTGTSNGSSKQGKMVKAVKRRLVAFAGRFDLDTSEDDLKQWLVNSGIKDVYCTRIKPKEGRKYQTAAFRVSCSEEYRDLFYNESSWPDGCELRDWFFTPNHSSPAGETASQAASHLSSGQRSPSLVTDGYSSVQAKSTLLADAGGSNGKMSDEITT